VEATWLGLQEVNVHQRENASLDPTQQPPQHGGRRLAETGMNDDVATDYIEREDGTIADEDVVRNICEYLRGSSARSTSLPVWTYLPRGATRWPLSENISTTSINYTPSASTLKSVKRTEGNLTYLSRPHYLQERSQKESKGNNSQGSTESLPLQIFKLRLVALVYSRVLPVESTKRKTSAMTNNITLPSPKRLRVQSPPESSESPTGTPTLILPTAPSTSMTSSTPTFIGDTLRAIHHLLTFSSVRCAPPVKKGNTPPESTSSNPSFSCELSGVQPNPWRIFKLSGPLHS
jgi:hypothetical protein